MIDWSRGALWLPHMFQHPVYCLPRQPRPLRPPSSVPTTTAALVNHPCPPVDWGATAQTATLRALPDPGWQDASSSMPLGAVPEPRLTCPSPFSWLSTRPAPFPISLGCCPQWNWRPPSHGGGMSSDPRRPGSALLISMDWLSPLFPCLPGPAEPMPNALGLPSPSMSTRSLLATRPPLSSILGDALGL
jgi:hypothetical protein